MSNNNSEPIYCPNLTRLIGTILQSGNVSDFFRILTSEIAKFLHCETAISALLRPDDMIEIVGAYGANADNLRGLKTRVTDSFLSPIFNSTNESSLNHSIITGEGARSDLLAVPIYKGEVIIGAVAVSDKAGSEAFSQNDYDAVTQIASIIPVILELEDLRKQNSKLHRTTALLSETMLAVSESLRPGLIVEQITDAVAGNFEAGIIVVFLYDDQTQELYTASKRGIELVEEKFDIESSAPLAHAFRSGKSLLLPDPDGVPLPSFLPMGTRSVLFSPIFSAEKNFGAILVGSNLPSAFSDEDEMLLNTVATQASAALSRAFLYEEASENAYEATKLYELTQALNLAESDSELFAYVCETAKDLIHIDEFCVMKPEGKHLFPWYECYSSISCSEYKPLFGEGIPGWVYANQAPVISQDISADSKNHSAPLPEGAASIICVPMQIGSKIIGVMFGITLYPRLFTVSDIETFYTIANLTASSIRRRK